MRIYGVAHGMALPVLLYPSAVLSSLASLLVPEISELRVQRQTERINSAVTRILRLSILYGIFVGGMFYAFAEPLSLRIFGDAQAARFLQILSPLVPIMYVDMSVDGLLKGLDEQKASMMYNIIDSAVCCLLVYFLLPKLAIKGYIIVLYVSEIYNFFFSVRRLLKVTAAPRPTPASIVQPLLCAACAALLPLGVSKMLHLGDLGHSTLGLVAAIGSAAGIYLGSLRLLGIRY
jgi:stage V sporulation protein B